MSQVDVNQNLPREVLRWIQSLDLAFSVKNIKRDFANGFLVAEIFSRYYAKEIQMHSYDNGNALKAKRDNWNQLLKVFRKIGMPQLLSEDEADLILRCEENHAVRFITKIYEVLTQRKVQTQVKKPTIGREPGYARDTAVIKTKETMRKLDISDSSDQLTAMRKIASVIDSHERTLKEQRTIEPERFSITNNIARTSTQMVPKITTDLEEEAPQLRVKEIHVKQLDRNVAHLRASKQMQGSTSQSQSQSQSQSIAGPTPRSIRAPQPRAVSPSGSRAYEKSLISNSSPVDRYQSQQGASLVENATSVINSCISRVAGPANLPSWSADLDPYQNLLVAIDSHKDGAEIDNVLAETLNEVRLSAQQLADACILTPKQFWKVSDLFCAVIVSSPYQSETYSTGVESFEAVGRWITQKEPKSSLTLFTDFALFKLTATLTSNAHKRLGLLRVLLGFTPSDPQSHILAIKKLQTAIPDLNIFITCLTILAAHENQMNDSLLDLYLYYGTIGLGLPSPKLRAGAMSVFASLLPQAVDVVIDMLPQFLQLASEESWWEIHAHLLSICGNLLEIQTTNQSGAETKSITLAIDIIKEVFSPSAPRNVRHWGLVALAPGLVYGEPLPQLYLNVLLHESVEDRLFFLGRSPDYSVRKIPSPSSTGLPFVLEPVIVRWYPAEIAAAIDHAVQSSSSDRLEPAPMDVLLACVKSVCEQDTASEPLTGSWKDLYTSLKDYIFVGFCDVGTVVSATGIMKYYIDKSPMHENILKESRFLGILRLLYPDDDSSSPECQRAVEDFLRDIFSFGDVFSSVVVFVIEQFAKSFIAQYEMSNLQSLLKEFLSEL